MSQFDTNDKETRAYTKALDAFCVTYAKELRGASVVDLVASRHVHVGVLALSDGRGLKFEVRINFDPELLDAATTAHLATISPHRTRTSGE